MKLLVFAHIPPPHHGQSYMVQLMLSGFGGDHRKTARPCTHDEFGIKCYHVDARLSQKLEDIGDLRFGKLALLIWYCLEAIWCRFRYGVTTMYYIPAPGKKSALYRDWVVMALCRPFFKRIILHWHAAGLAKWLETSVLSRSRTITYGVMKKVDLSIVLSQSNRADAEKLYPRRIRIVPNGIEDPCPDFTSAILPRRRARLAARVKLVAGDKLSGSESQDAGERPHVLNVLFLAHCTREKGLFDTLDAVALANQKLILADSPIRVHLNVAGEFIDDAEEKEFHERISRLDLQIPASSFSREQGRPVFDPAAPLVPCVSYRGFVSGKQKRELLTETDCFCFPSYFYAESFGVVLVEAMAFGLAIVSTRWRSIPEMFAPNYAGLVEVRSPAQVAETIIEMLTFDRHEELRDSFLRNFTLEQYLSGLAKALRSTTQPNQPVPTEYLAPVSSR